MSDTMELLRANNADLTKKNRQFALQHTEVHARNQELLAEANERSGELQELRKVNEALKRRLADEEQLISEAQELVFILIEGRKWETRYYKIKRHDPLVKIFKDFANHEQLALEKLTFMSKDRKTFYRGDQTAIEVRAQPLKKDGKLDD